MKLKKIDSFTAFVILFIFSCGSGSSFKTAPVAPTATLSLSPSSGKIGTLLTLTSPTTDLSNAQSVTVNGIEALILSKSATTLKVFVMPGTTTGLVSANLGTSSVSSSSAFTTSTSFTTGPTQQGNKLIGTGFVGESYQGEVVRLSADGNTAVVSGSGDDLDKGATWVFTRTNGAWSQEGPKLLGTLSSDAFGGESVAVSADGNTIASGSSNDSANIGAVWIFTRSGNTWSQQGVKLVGDGNIGSSGQGKSVALSADGNTLVVGGNTDNTNIGAVWVFTRTGTTWSQQGSKIVGSGYVGSPEFGTSVAVSADGKTLVATGYLDDAKGAAWVFTYTGSGWTQQGAKLTPTDWTSFFTFGTSSALSADGNTLVVGSNSDSLGDGAAFVFSRVSGVWSQQGVKLVGSGTIGNAYQGETVSLCADGNTLATGAFNDDFGVGAAWIFTRTGATWSQVGTKFFGTGSADNATQGFVSLSSDCSTLILGGFNDGVGNAVGATWFFTL